MFFFSILTSYIKILGAYALNDEFRYFILDYFLFINIRIKYFIHNDDTLDVGTFLWLNYYLFLFLYYKGYS